MEIFAKIDPANAGFITVEPTGNRVLKRAIKKVPGVTWNPSRRRWILPNSPTSHHLLARLHKSADPKRIRSALYLSRMQEQMTDTQISQLGDFFSWLSETPYGLNSGAMRRYLFFLTAQKQTATKVLYQVVQTLAFFSLTVLGDTLFTSDIRQMIR